MTSEEDAREKRKKLSLAIAFFPWAAVLWGLVESHKWIREAGDGDLYAFASMIPYGVAFFWFLALNRFAYWVDCLLPHKK